MIFDQDDKPKVEGDREGESAVGKVVVVAHHVVPAAGQAGGQVAHHVPVVANQHLLLVPPAAPAQPFTALTHPPTHLSTQENSH